MKKIFSFVFSLICLSVIVKAQNIAINTDGTAADASSILDVKSTTKGMLVPRMTTTQRTAITSPATGLLVFDTDTKSFWFYSGSAWTNISGGSAGSFTLPYNGSTASSTSALTILNTGAGAAIEGSGSGGAGVYGNSFSGAGVNALSTNGFGMVANSTNSSAIYGFNANTNSAIKGVNSVGDGVRGQSSGNGVAGVSGISTATSGYGVWGSSNTGTGVLAQSSTGVALEVNGNLKIAGGNTSPSDGAILTSDVNGNAVWKANRIAFGVRDQSTLAPGIPSDTWRKVQFGPTDFYDLGGNYDLLIGTTITPTSSSFTAPVAGIYHFDANLNTVVYESEITSSAIRFVRNSGTTTTIPAFSTASLSNDEEKYPYFIPYYADAHLSIDIYLLAGDRVHVEFYQKNVDGNDVSVNGTFTGHLVVAQ